MDLIDRLERIGQYVRLDHLDPFEGHALLERIETACGARLADIADELQRSQFPVCRANPAGRARLDREGSSAS